MSKNESRNGKLREGDFYIVGIGASAGGLEALEKFFDNTPDDTGLAFVVVQHLSPDFKSLMAELLAKHTTMKINKITEGMKVEPDNIYLIPAKVNLNIVDKHFTLSEQDHSVLNLPIDIFLNSLAEDSKENAIGVILSGTGSDGTRGIRAIKEAGGLAIVQEPSSTQFDGMPVTAIGTGLIDYVLPAEKIPVELLKYIKHPLIFTDTFKEDSAAEVVDVLQRICEVLQEHTSIDFFQYKPATILRRVERRMSIRQVKDLESYLQFLHKTPEEVTILQKELLIGVTKFFRDVDAYKSLNEKVLPEMIKESNSDTIRLWCSACSTGEEAYSIAMLCREYLDKVNPTKKVDLKIFATDVDKHAIDFASDGVYSLSIVSDVPSELLAKYFTKHGNNYQINQEIRELVIFAQHDILKDPPFNKIDLITCRNFLIYIKPEAQQKIMSFFQFSLVPNGVLFLGSSESIGDFEPYFKPVSSKWKIYKHLGGNRVPIHQHMSFNPSRHIERKRMDNSLGAYKKQMIGKFKEHLISEYAPAGVLIDENNQSIMTFGDVHKYLRVPIGEVDYNIMNMLPKELSLVLMSGVSKTKKDHEMIHYKNVRYSENGELKHVHITIKPHVDDVKKGDYLVIVFESPAINEVAAYESVTVDIDVQTKQRIEDLENDLKLTKENLQTTVEELETTNEELQATNEELMSSNEELQSTNEELQSVNEELVTVNSEHQAKIRELTEVNNDIDNLLNSTQLGVVFLDRDLLIRKFTPPTREVLNLIEMDVGRSITHITRNFDYKDFLVDLKRVIETGEMTRKTVNLENNSQYLIQINPYKVRAEYIDGLVITFIDQTVE